MTNRIPIIDMHAEAEKDRSWWDRADPLIRGLISAAGLVSVVFGAGVFAWGMLQ